VKGTSLTWLLTGIVVLLISVLVYMRSIGVSQRTVAIIAAIAFFGVSSSYIFLKRHLLSKQGIPQESTNWKKLVFLTVVGLALWIALILQYIHP
jgi:hypothetical protein